jgi:hypothetical protein
MVTKPRVKDPPAAEPNLEKNYDRCGTYLLETLNHSAD